MNRRVRGALVGAGAGAAIGAVYGFLFVTYRDMLASQQEGDRTPASELPDEPSASDRIREGRERDRAGYQAFLVRAKAIRAEHPQMRWQEAMKAARNGAEVSSPAPAPEGESE